MIEIEEGSFVIARSDDRLLPQLPAVGRLLGTRWNTLYRLEDRWQCLLLLSPYPHQYQALGTDLDELVAATGAPVLVGAVADKDCVRLLAGSPAGNDWSAHLSISVTDDGVCGYGHHLLALLPMPASERAVRQAPDLGQVLAWVAEARLPASTDLLRAVLATDYPGRDATPECFVEPLGLALLDEVEPLFHDFQGEWSTAYHKGWEASSRACRRWTLPADETPDDGEIAKPWDAACTEFLDLVSAARYGMGMTRRQLADRASEIGLLLQGAAS